MTFASVDDLVRYFMALDEQCGSVPAQRLTTSAGCRCGMCGAMGTMAYSRSHKRVCFACGHGWTGIEIEVPRTRIDGGADWRKACDVRDRRIDMHRKLEPIVRPKPRGDVWRGSRGRRLWRFTLLAYGAYLQPQCGSYERVCDWGMENHRRLIWTRSRVIGAVKTARYVIGNRARKEGLLPGWGVGAVGT